MFLTGIAVFTAAFGRLWCGWTCPQTVMMEMVFRKLEYLIEGDGHAAERCSTPAPWTAGKVAKKAAKHASSSPCPSSSGTRCSPTSSGLTPLLQIVTDDPRHHLAGLAFMGLFTLVFYGIFARFREQACTFICPYGRLQSTLLDENTIVVAYDYKRGEKRGHAAPRRDLRAAQRRGGGDCIDCFKCVTVCPTGIDIRNGTQMECVNCTACIDACDDVMEKIGRPRGLIRFASLNGIEKGERLRVTPRLAAYCIVLLGLIALGPSSCSPGRRSMPPFCARPAPSSIKCPRAGSATSTPSSGQQNPPRNAHPVETEQPAGDLQVMGQDIVVPGEKLVETSLLIELNRGSMKSGTTPLVIGVYSGARKISTVKSAFIGPRDDSLN